MKIILPLTKTELHRQAEVLIRRYKLRDWIFEELQNIHGRENAGYQGEGRLDYYLNISNLRNTFSLAGLRLKGGDYFFQIDRLLLTPTVCFIIESKNLKGKLHLNDQDQLIQQTPEQQKSYDNPYTQVKLQEKQFRKVLNQHGFTHLPIERLVVFTNQSAILNLGDNPNLIPLQQLTFRIDELCERGQQIFTTKQMNTFSKLLSKKHTPKKEDLIKRFKIGASAIQTGVICKYCEQGIMNRVHANWKCQKCQKTDARAHIQALADYATLFGPLITNKAARQFLRVDSPDTMYRLMLKLHLPIVGNHRGTQYNLSKLKYINTERTG